jgi:hypothetical protein
MYVHNSIVTYFLCFCRVFSDDVDRFVAAFVAFFSGDVDRFVATFVAFFSGDVDRFVAAFVAFLSRFCRAFKKFLSRFFQAMSTVSWAIARRWTTSSSSSRTKTFCSSAPRKPQLSHLIHFNYCIYRYM